MRLSPVAAAYRGPYSNKGYLSARATRMTQRMVKPPSAPARVDWTRWEIPIAVPAQRRPGPNAPPNPRGFRRVTLPSSSPNSL